ncbi:junctional sarcoplasmic reticulum protein 1 isoform X2 [Nematostella vectensis]|uniref:junctional sarcoplasmic reticulum protein 1 isoform X2 n=1 Tax=Nematostella vectensis TaxID=45351 RepID=UPI0020776635|nr:junctional sarcoplasmic reticulum protein 1 isoform X2 [Nematostella vectensis]
MKTILLTLTLLVFFIGFVATRHDFDFIEDELWELDQYETGSGVEPIGEVLPATQYGKWRPYESKKKPKKPRKPKKPKKPRKPKKPKKPRKPKKPKKGKWRKNKQGGHKDYYNEY